MAKNKDKKTPVTQEDTATDDTAVVQDDVSVEELQAQITQLEKKLKDQEEITQRAQSDYYRLKMDWDQYVTRTESMKANLKVESLISTAQKLLPAVSQLKQTVATMPPELTESSWAQWVQLVYSKISGQLETLNIQTIEPELWTEPDLMYHIPLSSQPVEDKKQQGKIITVIETWFLFKKDDSEKVITPAKVVVGG